jgi:glycosyltransferase involved in cell wall biosynthesis
MIDTDIRTVWPSHAASVKPQGERRNVIAVVIPCFRVRAHIIPLLARIGPEVARIFVIDDACPESTGAYVRSVCRDRRVVVVAHEENQGVGGAVITGYRHAMSAGADIVVKLDGDGQMDPALIPSFVAPILQGRADYVKGNRFHNIEDVRAMPIDRLIGNAALSFMTKMASGYWNVFDPTNGYTAISAAVLSHLPLHKVQRRYFFESDMLFRLGTMQALVLDLPMTAVYGEEQSGLKIRRVLAQFLLGNVGNCCKRIFYGYFLRGFSLASLQLLTGLLFLLFGILFGLNAWAISSATGVAATTGTVMLAALPVILGVQFLLSFLAFDIAAVPTVAIASLLPERRQRDVSHPAEVAVAVSARAESRLEKANAGELAAYAE